MITKRAVTLAGAIVLAASASLGGVAAAGPAAASSTIRPHSGQSGNCKVWTDGNTAGFACTGGLYNWNIRAGAQCWDGIYQLGPYQSGTSGRWSYAYCSADGNIEFFNLIMANHFYKPGHGHPGRTGPARASIRPDSVNGNCTVWADSNTVGLACTGLPGYTYTSSAICNDNTTQWGPSRYGTSGQWSYAYCSGHGGLNFPQPQFA